MRPTMKDGDVRPPWARGLPPSSSPRSRICATISGSNEPVCASVRCCSRCPPPAAFEASAPAAPDNPGLPPVRTPAIPNLLTFLVNPAATRFDPPPTTLRPPVRPPAPPGLALAPPPGLAEEPPSASIRSVKPTALSFPGDIARKRSRPPASVCRGEGPDVDGLSHDGPDMMPAPWHWRPKSQVVSRKFKPI